MAERTCSIPGCTRKYLCRGWCESHYERWRKYGDPEGQPKPRERKPRPKCTVAGCERANAAHGYCDLHYRRWQQHGDPLGGVHKPRGTIAERFWPKVDKDGPIPDYAPHLGPCWIWTSARDGNGYGRIRVSNAVPQASAHRVAYEFEVGPVPDGLELDHLCRVPLCVNPTHLEPVTHRENMLRGNTVGALNAVKTHCLRGHPFDAENTYVKPSDGKRSCRQCARDQHLARKANR